ncbi:MAG TPA: 5-oxoprolinase subunit PxpA [Opitutaceae bacterium]|nr:5-oxoprolinase subunit PxpA [Opitutaceae bacterium]
MHCIDLNCDLGEGAGHDAELMPCITSANIACGGHAGDVATMRAAVALALKHGVAVGAHPGFADREHFGRRDLPLSPSDVAGQVGVQIQALQEVAFDLGTVVRHVKLHGALYNRAARDRALAEAIVRIARMTAKEPVLFALAGSALERVARAYDDVRVVAEGFADRTYQADGSLTPRSQPGALIEEADAMAAQVLRMVRDGRVRATDGTDVPLAIETVCVHGDGPHAVAFVQRLARELRQAGIERRAPTVSG